MTISGALSNAMSGLRAAGRSSEIVSSNISNALTPGYGVRSLSLSSSTIGAGGVMINGVSRHSDAALTADVRLANAEYGDTRARSEFLNTIENLLGTPDEPDAISSFLSRFESKLIVAASRPEAVDRLDQSVTSARDLINAIGKASSGIQDARTAADQ
ncbi:MAG: flagellar basal body protein, partial [Sulfitobacter sp.]